jgi:hypothetical protein
MRASQEAANGLISPISREPKLRLTFRIGGVT